MSWILKTALCGHARHLAADQQRRHARGMGLGGCCSVHKRSGCGLVGWLADQASICPISISTHRRQTARTAGLAGRKLGRLWGSPRGTCLRGRRGSSSCKRTEDETSGQVGDVGAASQTPVRSNCKLCWPRSASHQCMFSLTLPGFRQRRCACSRLHSGRGSCRAFRQLTQGRCSQAGRLTADCWGLADGGRCVHACGGSAQT